MMKRQRVDGDQNPPPTLHLSFVETATSAISECIEELLRMNALFPQCLSIGSLDKQRREVGILCIKSSVLCRLEMLFKEPNEGGQNPTSQGRRLTRPYLPTAKVAFDTISGCISDLCKLQQLIVQWGKSILEEESPYEEALGIKSGVVSRLELFLEETEKADGEAMDVEGSDEYEDENVEESNEYEDLPCGFQFSSWPHVPMDDTADGIEFEEPWELKETFKWSGVNEEGVKEKERYLCVSNGFAIWCLDLKQSKSNTPCLPKIGTLNLLGGQLPASVGLFKLGSDAYIIGGQELPESVKGCVYRVTWCRNPQGIDLYKALCVSEGIKGSSGVSHHLYLAVHKDGTLRLYHNKAVNIEELKQPKVWPVVEKIGDKLHVMDSLPALLCGSCEWTFSHEVGNLECRGWEAITPTIEEEVVDEEVDSLQITSHVVVGNRIYAVTNSGRRRYTYIGFDSETGKWEGCTPQVLEWSPNLEVRVVGDILRLGFGRCVGEYRHGGGGPYVVVAIMKDFDNYPNDIHLGTLAIAFLVTLTGQAICYQVLSDFFEEPLHPCDMSSGGTMIHVEEDTMCSVFSARIKQDDYNRDYLFINTFSVEVLPDAADKVDQLLAVNASKVQPGPAVEQTFVRFARKGWYIYETDADLKFRKGDLHGQFVGWQACFLSPPPT